MRNERLYGSRLVLQHFSATTTVGGLTQIYNAPHMVLKIFWFGLFIVFTGLSAYNTYTVFDDYFSYPVLTYVSVTYNRSLLFPAVTLCNLNPVPCSNLANAYVKEPDTYRELFSLSGCIKKVSALPLIFKVANETENPEFTAMLKARLVSLAATYLSSITGGSSSGSGGVSGGGGSGGVSGGGGSGGGGSPQQGPTVAAGNSATTLSTGSSGTTQTARGIAGPPAPTGSTGTTLSGTTSTASPQQTSNSSNSAAATTTTATPGTSQSTTLPSGSNQTTAASTASAGTTQTVAGATVAQAATTTTATAAAVTTTTAAQTTTAGATTATTTAQTQTQQATTTTSQPTATVKSGTSGLSAPLIMAAPEESDVEVFAVDSSGSGQTVGQTSSARFVAGPPGGTTATLASLNYTVDGLRNMTMYNLTTALMTILNAVDPSSMTGGVTSTAKSTLEGILNTVFTEYVANVAMQQRSAASYSTTKTSVSSTATPQQPRLANYLQQQQTSYSSGTTSTSDSTSTTRFSLATAASGFTSAVQDINDASEDYRKSEAFVLKLAELNRKLSTKAYQKLTKPFNEFILSCEFQGNASCSNAKYFSQVPDPEYGSCFTFNSYFNQDNDTAAGSRTVGVTGKLNGLTLELLLSATEYLPTSLANSEGIRVVIHDPTARPAPGDDGFNIRPNTVTDVALHLVQVSRMESPYQSNCYDSWSQTDFMPLSPNDLEEGISERKEDSDVAYTYGACQEMCEAVHILETCGCLNPRNLREFWYKDQRIGRNDSLCVVAPDKNSTKVSDYYCMTNTRLLLQAGNLTCDSCSLPCDDNLYQHMISTATWPATGYMNTVVNKYMSIYSSIGGPGSAPGSTSDMETVVKSEFAKINIYFKTLNLETIEEQAKYDIWGFLSSVGGAVGLYLGMCGVSVIEVAELIILLILAGGFKKWWVKDENESPMGDTVAPMMGPPNPAVYKEPGKDLMEKMFRLTDSAKALRERHVYPIRVPPAQEQPLYPKPPYESMYNF